MRALVLSGGGLFGAWQAGAWSVLAQHYQPDLIVGCSIGSLNGYLIASGIETADLLAFWRDPAYANLRRLPTHLDQLTTQYSLRKPFAVVVTDLFRLKPVIYKDAEITSRHLAASCAVPLLMPQVKLNGRWSTDGGLLNPYPTWAAIQLGATEIVGLQVMEKFPTPWLQPASAAFGRVAGHHPVRPSSVKIKTLKPSQRLGYLRDSVRWNAATIDRWIALGIEDASRIVIKKSFPF